MKQNRMAGGDPMRRGACNVDLCAVPPFKTALRATLGLWGSGALEQKSIRGVDSAEAAAKHAHLQLLLAVASANATLWPLKLPHLLLS